MWKLRGAMSFMKNLFVAIAIAFVVFTPPAMALHDVNRIVAIVDDDVIVRTELNEAIVTISAQFQQQNATLPSPAVLERQVLERLILQHIQLQLASTSGIKVDDETLAAAISNIAERNHVSLTEFRDTLEHDGYKFDKFREDIRNQIIIGRLHQREVVNHITVTDQEVNDFLASSHSEEAGSAKDEGEWKLAQILVAVPDGASPEQIQTARTKAESLLARLRSGEDFRTLAINESNARDALEGGDLGWRRAAQIPSLFSSIVSGMRKGEVVGPVRGPSGFHIVKFVDYRNQAVGTVTQTLVRHILIHTSENVTDEEARAHLAQLRIRIQSGEDFGELARANSEDTASAANKGSLGWVNPGDLVADFEKVMDGLIPGAISEPFKTSFGWHIAQVQERRQQNNTQEKLRTNATEAIRTRKTEEGLDAWLRRLREEAYVEIHLDSDG